MNQNFCWLSFLFFKLNIHFKVEKRDEKDKFHHSYSFYFHFIINSKFLYPFLLLSFNTKSKCYLYFIYQTEKAFAFLPCSVHELSSSQGEIFFFPTNEHILLFTKTFPLLLRKTQLFCNSELFHFSCVFYFIR